MQTHEPNAQAQGKRGGADVLRVLMSGNTEGNVIAASASPDRRRTVVAVLSASIISLVLWGLVVVLNVH